MGGMASDGGANLSAIPRHFAADQRLVKLFHAASGKLGRERQMSLIILCDDQATAGVFVEAMNDAGPGHATDSAKLAPAMVQQCIDQGVLLVASGGMHDDSRRLVEHEQSLVLKYDLQRDFLRPRFGSFGFRPMDADLFASARRMSGFDLAAINLDVSLFDESLDRTTGNGRKHAAQIGVQPL